MANTHKGGVRVRLKCSPVPRPAVTRPGVHNSLDVSISKALGVIEQSIFAKLKYLLRKAAARSIEAVYAAIGQLLGSCTPKRMRQLLQKRRRWTNLNASRF
jgi:hypothetical protein